jgi:hypothetical protein
VLRLLCTVMPRPPHRTWRVQQWRSQTVSVKQLASKTGGPRTGRLRPVRFRSSQGRTLVSGAPRQRACSLLFGAQTVLRTLLSTLLALIRSVRPPIRYEGAKHGLIYEQLATACSSRVAKSVYNTLVSWKRVTPGALRCMKGRPDQDTLVPWSG